MSGLEIYILFALTTAIAGIYELLLPVLSRKTASGGLYPSKWLYIITAFVLFLLFAPLVVLSCIIPSWSESFQDGLLESMFEQESKIRS